MKKIYRANFIYKVVLAFVVIISLAFESHKSSLPVNSSQYILELSKKKWQWVIGREVDSLTNLLTDDFESKEPDFMMDKSGYLDMVENTNIEYKEVVLLESSIRVDDNLCILTVKSKFTEKQDSSIYKIKYIIEIYKNTDKDWKLKFLQIYPSN